MITVFSCPKAFNGVSRIHQYNAVQSWKMLHPDVEVILVGDDAGIAEACRELGVTHIPECERNEYGTPLISSIFGQARAHARHSFLCYANGDIILTRYFLACFLAVRKRAVRFLLVGKRWDIDCETKLDFAAPSWEPDLIAYAQDHGQKASEWQIDYFAFPATEFRELPPFAVGRVRWDNWMIWKARTEKSAVIDASDLVTAIHQNHDYSHHPKGQQGVWEGPEATANHDLTGGWEHVYSINDASHKIRGFGRHPFFYPVPRTGYLLSKIIPAVTPWARAVRESKAYVTGRNAVRMILQGNWALAWTKFVKKLKARRK
jgi:hypothetical protein